MATETQANREQIEFWNGDAGQVWARHQLLLDGTLDPLAAAAIEAAAVQPGERVIDVGCGCGSSALALAAAGGQVTGVDISAPMLDLARQRSSGGNPAFVQADAATHAFNGDADLVFSRFGVMFFSDPAAAFANLRAALKPGGRLCFLCWRKPADNPWLSLPMRAAMDLLPEQPPADPLAPGPFAFADPERLRGILTQAGFADVDIAAHDPQWRSSADDARLFYAEVGPMARLLADVDADTAARVQAAIDAVLEQHRQGSEVVLGAGCWLVTAHNP